MQKHIHTNIKHKKNQPISSKKKREKPTNTTNIIALKSQLTNENENIIYLVFYIVQKSFKKKTLSPHLTKQWMTILTDQNSVIKKYTFESSKTIYK